jgi:hypothetical protein
MSKHWELLIFVKSSYYACPQWKSCRKVQGLSKQKQVTILEAENIH